jgi:ribosome-associated protein
LTEPQPPGAPPSGERRIVAISEEPIRLGQFLKLAGLVGSGAEVRPLLMSGVIEVNGVEEQRRGRQLRRGDRVTGPGGQVVVG